MVLWFFGLFERGFDQLRTARRTEQWSAAENQFAVRSAVRNEKAAIETEPLGAGKMAEKLVKDWIALLMRAIVWALALYLFVMQVSVVRGQSMEPNFHEGERLLLDKATFDFRAPHQGEVIVFEAQTLDRESGRQVRLDFIKRVIGMPGDRVTIHSGKVFVNGAQLQEEWKPERFQYWEELIGPENARTYVVPPGHYFVLGDRRWNSEDSRGERIGFVALQQIKGKVRCKFWPLEHWTWY